MSCTVHVHVHVLYMYMYNTCTCTVHVLYMYMSLMSSSDTCAIHVLYMYYINTISTYLGIVDTPTVLRGVVWVHHEGTVPSNTYWGWGIPLLLFLHFHRENLSELAKNENKSHKADSTITSGKLVTQLLQNFHYPKKLVIFIFSSLQGTHTHQSISLNDLWMLVNSLNNIKEITSHVNTLYSTCSVRV